MEIAFLGFGIPVLILGFAVFCNLLRDRRHFNGSLKPNCLLTRQPVVFLTGPRSLFYFRKYWNTYPALLAEHGYPVFTVHLPWRGPQRLQRFQEFLKSQEALQKKFHFVCDAHTQKELAALWTSPSVMSLTVMPEETLAPAAGRSRLLELSYRLHLWTLQGRKGLPSAQTLGIHGTPAAVTLLERMQELAEEDYLEGPHVTHSSKQNHLASLNN